MVSNEGKEILRGIGLLAEHIICAADSYCEVADKRKVVNDISETAARVKKEVKHISIKDLKTLNDKCGIAIFEYVDSIKKPPNPRVNARPHTRAPLTCRQFYAKLQLRAESRNPALSPQKLIRLYPHFGA